jgi:LacI family transcriptional regulator
MQKKKIRLSDIAEQLNVSTVTVSKALTNKEGVGDSLRKQIKDLAESMGYKTKKTASQDKSKITGNIGIIIPSRYFKNNNSYYWYIFNHLTTALLQKNFYSIMELVNDDDESAFNLPRMIQDSKIDGLIILGQVSNEYVETIHTHFDNFILLDFYTDDPSLDCVTNDNFYCSYLMTKHAIALGHKNLTFVGNYKATTSIRDRYMGFLKALLEEGIKLNPSDVLNDRKDDSAEIEIKLPENLKLPSAYICNCDETAAALISLLQARGIKVPQDVSVTGFDNYVSNTKDSIPLTTVNIRPEDIADVASELIIKKISGVPYIKGHHTVSGTIIERDSLLPK